MITLSVHLAYLERRIEDLDKRLNNDQLELQERQALKDERRGLARSYIHFFGYFLQGAA